MKGYVLPEPSDSEAYWCAICNKDWMTRAEAEGHSHHMTRPAMPQHLEWLMDALLDEGLLRRPDERERETWDYNVQVVERVSKATFR